MLTSLFENNQDVTFDFYVLYHELTEVARLNLANIIESNNHRVKFVYVDPSIYDTFPTTKNLTVECYFVCLAHMILPPEIDRILYLDSDLIIDGSIRDLYSYSFEGNYIIACGQSYERIDGNYFKIGARPERGELFNSGVMVFDLDMMRMDISKDTFEHAALNSGYNFSLADQGILNIVYEGRVKYVDSFLWNCRIGLLEEHVMAGYPIPTDKPRIYHFVNRDYYRMGRSCKPWTLFFSSREYDLLKKAGIINCIYDLREVERFNLRMQNLWWSYARKTTIYKELKDELTASKKQIMAKWYINGVIVENEEKEEEYRYLREKFGRLDEGHFTFDQARVSYDQLEKYIDSIEVDRAISTMKSLFSYNLAEIRKKGKAKVAFIVYSSAEWQCEDIYRLMDKDDMFEPVIAICGYSHGNEKTIRDTYTNTCKFFRNNSREYHIEFLGYKKRYMPINQLDKYDILFYFNPSLNVYTPDEVNVSRRHIRQLIIHVPYGIYTVNKQDACYKVGFYELPVIKMAWRYYAELKKSKSSVVNESRMKGYNVEVSGYPKLDELLYGQFTQRKDLWKNEEKSELRIIWAPHFNQKKGMNGTFFENYRWMLNFARQHKEISWIVRPHPRMAVGVVIENHVFDSFDEYLEYFDQWDQLPNARVIEGGGYYDIFASSDGMIHDCGSFVSEYMYTGKPMLLLVPEVPRAMNEIGEELHRYLYMARGNDFDKIENYIVNLKEHIDPLKEGRDGFISDQLDYRRWNGGISASEYIFNSISKEIRKE